MSRGPGRVQRFVTGHLAALEGEWCPAPDLAVAYALASGVPLEMRHGRRDYQRAIPYAPRPTEEAVYRACRVLADSGVISWSRNAYGLFMESYYRQFPPWRYCYRDLSFPAREWPPPGGESWRERCRTPLSVAAVPRVPSRNTYVSPSPGRTGP